MGIKSKTTIEYTCDRCGADAKDYFTNFHLPLGGDGRDVTFWADVRLEYVVDYAGKQIVCNKCAANFLRQTAEKLDPVSIN